MLVVAVFVFGQDRPAFFQKQFVAGKLKYDNVFLKLQGILQESLNQ